jgi:histone H3/H4
MTDIKGERRYANAGYSWQRSALGALQEATEAFLTRFFEGKTIAPNPFLLF